MTPGEVLSIIVMPLVLVAIGISWPYLQSKQKGEAFQRLILRELQEISPYPVTAMDTAANTPDEIAVRWKEHQTKKFVHREIFKDLNGNRDFILSLDPDLVYFVSQLWDNLEAANSDQWLHYLTELSDPKYDESRCIKAAQEKWDKLINEYKKKLAQPNNTP